MGRMLQELISADDELEQTDEPVDAIIDFSSPTGLLAAIEMALALKVPLVSGTTGLNEEHFEKLHLASSQIAVMHSPNFSIGMAALFSALEQLKNLPGATFEILETHHIHKKDAPSGSALKLQKILKGASITSERTGEVVGEHEVVIRFASESLTLRHSVQSRRAFAEGALLSVKFLLDKPAGYYDFSLVL